MNSLCNRNVAENCWSSPSNRPSKKLPPLNHRFSVPQNIYKDGEKKDKKQDGWGAEAFDIFPESGIEKSRRQIYKKGRLHKTQQTFIFLQQAKI